jgi:hypothetical protein
MSIKKFGVNDVNVNTMRTHPKCEFFIYDGRVHYNDTPSQTGKFSSQVLNVPSGHISLYEYNIDRAAGTNPLIYPFVTKNGSNIGFRTTTTASYNQDFVYGDVMSSSYPLSASITREYMAGNKGVTSAPDPLTPHLTILTPTYRHFYALKNRLDFYGTLSQHYKVSSSYGDKFTQTLNLISIPSIFFGDRIKPGTINLKWYLTGSLIGELKDEKQNGELIQTGPVGSTGSGSVAGVVMYNEGFVLLTGSWALSNQTINLVSGAAAKKPGWIYFGAGALDNVNQTTAGVSYVSASFNMSFRGTNDIQTVTMFTHARQGEVNYSNNPTFLQYGQTQIQNTSSAIYEENDSRLIYNSVSSSYVGYDADFKKQVYISRVAIYDENKNLLGIATLSNPVLKKEDEDLSFKIKLDI